VRVFGGGGKGERVMCVIRPEDGEKLRLPGTRRGLVGRMRRALRRVIVSVAGAEAALLLAVVLVLGPGVLDVGEAMVVWA
jgi:hypothetical protein